MPYDSNVQGLSVETERGSVTYDDRPVPTVRELKYVWSDKLVRSEANGCFNELTGELYEQFKKDIQQNGQLHPVLIHENKVLDGWTRCRACRDLGRQVLVLEIGEDIGRPLTHEDLLRATLSSQFSRGDFSKIQKAAIIRDLVDATILRGRPRKRSESDSFLDDLAREYGVPKTYLVVVGTAKRKNPEMFEKIKAGKISYSKVETEFNDKKRRKGKKGEADMVSAKPKEKDRDHQQVNVRQDANNQAGGATSSMEPPAPAPLLKDRENGETGQVEDPRSPEPTMVGTGTLSSDETGERSNIDEDSATKGEFFSKALGIQGLKRPERLKKMKEVARWILPALIRYYSKDEQPSLTEMMSEFFGALGIDLN